MPTYTRRLGAGSYSAANAWLELARATDGVTTVLRDLILTNPTTAAAGQTALRVRPVTKAGEWWLWYGATLPIGTTHVELRQVLEPSEALELFSDHAGLYYAITGYVLGA